MLHVTILQKPIPNGQQRPRRRGLAHCRSRLSRLTFVVSEMVHVTCVLSCNPSVVLYAVRLAARSKSPHHAITISLIYPRGRSARVYTMAIEKCPEHIRAVFRCKVRGVRSRPGGICSQEINKLGLL